MELERTIAPSFSVLQDATLVDVQHHSLDNGVEVYGVEAGSQNIIRIEFIFNAGIKYQGKPIVAAASNTLIFEGTPKYSANEIADKIDYYGAFFETEITQDTASVYLYTLSKYLDETLSIVSEVLQHANFPKDELENYVRNRKSKFVVNQQKVGNVSRKKFMELLFGAVHPYGYNVKLEDYDSVRTDDLSEFFENHYGANNCKIIIAGSKVAPIVASLNKHFGKEWKSHKSIKDTPKEFYPSADKYNKVEKKDALQSAIRVGRGMFNKTHDDYLPMQIVNCILGGYFGSRLMANIREDKGYTYGIGSAIISLQDAGYFFITTEVGAEVCKNALAEIYKELALLCEEQVGADELTLVRNYMMGSFLRSINGPFAQADRLKGVLLFGMDYNYYKKFQQTIMSISSEEIKDLAQKYLSPDDMIELVVGP